jgi:hypothetical protein
MLTMCLLGLCCAAAFAGTAPWLGRRLPPRTAIYLLVGGAVLTTASVLSMLAFLGATVLAQLPVVATAGHWSPSVLHSTDPVPRWAAACSLALLPAALATGAAATAQHVAAMARLRRTCRDLDAPGEVVVLDSDRPDAFATPAGGGRVVVTTGMLRCLRPEEVGVLIAHERSHLRHRHTLWMMAVQICAAINPLLRDVAGAAGHAAERWADEDAAAVVGDRRLVARTLARAALHVHDTVGGLAPEGTGAVGLGAVDGAVVSRVRSLLAGPPRRQVAASLVLIALMVSALSWTAGMQDRTDDFLDAAHAHGVTTHSPTGWTGRAR